MKQQYQKATASKLVQITSGRGPAECCWVVAQVLKELLREARAAGIAVDVNHRTAGPEAGTLASATLTLRGNQLPAFLAGWSGTVQWIGQSPYRRYHRRKNWFVGVADFEPPGRSTWRETDLEFKTKRASGPGGQHVNKTESAVQATHRPTGLSVDVSESRSQLQNRKIAVQRLEQLVRSQAGKQAAEQVAERWLEHCSLERGNPVRVYRDRDFKPVKR